jgi:hypothetical protein
MDVDDEADLRALLRHDLTGTQTGAFLNDSGIVQRLSARQHETTQPFRAASQT